MKWSFKVVCRITLWSFGCWWIDYQERDLDYSKYLCPNWKKKYGKAGIICSNHLNWLDIIIFGWHSIPCGVAKADIEKIPVVGPMGRQFGCLFFDREVKSEKKDIV